MVYSKRVTDLQQIYQLTPDDVFFCMLVASGASRGEAYATIFRPRSTKIETAQRGAAQLAKDKPGINKLIRSFEDNRAAFLPDNDSPKSKKKKKNTETEEEEKAGNVVQYRDKDAVLSGLEQTLPYLRGQRSCRCINENSRFTTDEEGRKYRRRGRGIHFVLKMK